MNLRKQLTPEGDKALWIQTRLPELPRRGRTKKVLDERRKLKSVLASQYDKLTRHEPPTVYAYGHRMSERATILFAR